MHRMSALERQVKPGVVADSSVHAYVRRTLAAVNAAIAFGSDLAHYRRGASEHGRALSTRAWLAPVDPNW